MKIKILFIGLFLSTVSMMAQSEKINWEKDYKNAIKLAKKQDKLVLLFFTGSDWCGPCKMLVADFFESGKLKKIADKNFVLYEADFPRNQDLVSVSQRKDNLNLSNKYGIESYPSVLIIDVKGKLIGTRKGYNLMRDPSYYYNLLNNSISK